MGRKILKCAIKSGVLLGGSYAVLNSIAKKKKAQEAADEYLHTDLYSGAGKPSPFYQKTFYSGKIKPLADKALSLAGLVALSPVYGLISAAIYIEDPAPVIFTQKRVGENKKYFYIHKFRSMKTSAPHEVPTHLLENPDLYTTKVGKFLRKNSLDELPQLWDIFMGNMSFVGPRPALWNQTDLVEQRERYCANSVKPGLTGRAQSCGTCELEVDKKAGYDGEYAQTLAKDNLSGVKEDAKCVADTLQFLFNRLSAKHGKED